jgi:hypothetical protein
MLWVAGVPANAVDIPTTGSATYSGHAVANISNVGTQYLATGTFTNTVDFGNRKGAMQIAGLDTSTYGGNVTFGSGSSSPIFFGSLNTGPSNRVMTVAGSIYQGGPSNSTPLYGEMGGSFSITGPGNYIGSGIFAGRKP